MESDSINRRIANIVHPWHDANYTFSTASLDISVLSSFMISPIARAFIPFLCGMATIFLLMKPGLWQGEYTFNAAILIEAAVFGLAGLLGCAIAPTRPFQAAFTGLVGAFVGMIADVIIHPTVQGGFERNLFPLEIALHTIIAAPSLFLVALFWKVGAPHFTRMRKDS